MVFLVPFVPPFRPRPLIPEAFNPAVAWRVRNQVTGRQHASNPEPQDVRPVVLSPTRDTCLLRSSTDSLPEKDVHVCAEETATAIESSADVGSCQKKTEAEFTIGTSFVQCKNDGENYSVEEDELDPDSDTTNQESFGPTATGEGVLPQCSGNNAKDSCDGFCFLDDEVQPTEEEEHAKTHSCSSANADDNIVANGINTMAVEMGTKTVSDSAPFTVKKANNPNPPEIFKIATTKKSTKAMRASDRRSFSSILQTEREPQDPHARESIFGFNLGEVVEDERSRLFDASSQLTTPPGTEKHLPTSQIGTKSQARSPAATPALPLPSAQSGSYVKRLEEKYNPVAQSGRKQQPQAASSPSVPLPPRPKPVPVVKEGGTSGKKPSIAQRMQSTLRANEVFYSVQSKVKTKLNAPHSKNKRLEFVDNPPTSPVALTKSKPEPVRDSRKSEKRSRTDSKATKQRASAISRIDSDAETDSFYDLPGGPTVTKRKKLLTRKLPSAGKAVTATVSTPAH